ncbi:MAG: hypothetical protein HY562_13235 [Ignavibacteriales bacterium]|nr:hypothetical protein [Ignavibacteriales bacterium]
MNKRLWMGFVAVFVTLEITSFLVNGVLLASTYESLKSLWREDMMSKMWIYHVITLIGSFFFTLVFSKGYEAKGMMEGVRYGAYIGIWLSVGMAYGTYASIAIPYSLALQWFLYGIVEYVIAGVVLAMVFAKVGKDGSPAA